MLKFIILNLSVLYCNVLGLCMLDPGFEEEVTGA